MAPRFRVTFGGTYLDSIYTDNTSAPGLEGCTGLAGCPTVQNLTGKTLAFAPKLQGNIGAEWKSQPFMNGISLALAVNEHFTSNFLTANTLNEQSRVPGYATTDLRLSLIAEGDKWRLDLFGENIFDKHYFVTTVAQTLGAAMGINNNTTGTTVFRGFLGSPANFGARLSLNF
jgi:iron complex outermembrane receptor protein